MEVAGDQMADIRDQKLRLQSLPSRSGGFARESIRSFQAAGAFWKAPILGSSEAFTLIELLVVITIIVILMGLLFPAFRGVQDQAKKTQAKNDLTQIVTAVNAFYTEYGKYPVVISDAVIGPGGNPATNESLFNVLRGLDLVANPRQIVFINPADAKDQTTPRGGIETSTGRYFDPWNKQYVVAIDGDYDNEVPNPYSSNAGSTPKLRNGVIAWSLGTDGDGGNGDKKNGTAADDVISWQ